MPHLVTSEQEWTLATLRALDEMTMLDVVFNHVKMKLPAGTLLTMVHCSHLAGLDLQFYVETQHGQWMLNNVLDGDIFIDVGAATGASLMPIALTKPAVRIIAFEPTIRASRLLRGTLAANGVEIVLFNAAVCNSHGIATFREFKYDPNDVPFLTEASSLVEAADTDSRAIYNQIPTVKLDDLGIHDQRIMVKVDVEGAEEQVLLGSAGLLENNCVKLSIDIHGDTEEPCRAVLDRFGYKFERVGHVLLCEPASQ